MGKQTNTATEKLNSAIKMQHIAAGMHNMHETGMLMANINNLLGRRQMIARAYTKGFFNDPEMAIAEFEAINEQIKQYLNL